MPVADNFLASKAHQAALSLRGKLMARRAKSHRTENG